MGMKFRLFTAVALILAGVLASCQTQRQPYKGYKKSAYTIKGHRFVPMDVHPALSYKAEGIASFYEGSGGVNAIGERLRSGEYYAAHRTLPLPCVVKITSLANGKSSKYISAFSCAVLSLSGWMTQMSPPAMAVHSMALLM